MADLSEFLAQAARTPFAWGVWDCCLMPADWVQRRRGVDPAAHLRGRYASAEECARLLEDEGGLGPVFARCAEIAGLRLTRKPMAGDVGLIGIPTIGGPGLAGAICTGRDWAFLAERGLVQTRARVLAAWGV